MQQIGFVSGLFFFFFLIPNAVTGSIQEYEHRWRVRCESILFRLIRCMRLCRARARAHARASTHTHTAIYGSTERPTHCQSVALFNPKISLLNPSRSLTWRIPYWYDLCCDINPVKHFTVCCNRDKDKTIQRYLYTHTHVCSPHLQISSEWYFSSAFPCSSCSLPVSS